MSRPKNKEEYRQQMAETFIGVLEEKGLEWHKEWMSNGVNAPRNGITKACYRGNNIFWLSLISMMKGYSDPRWVTMVQIIDKDAKYHPNQKWHLKAGTKATYVEYWYPYDLNRKKALTWDQYKEELNAGRKTEDFRLNTRYTAVFNAEDIEGIPENTIPMHFEIQMDEMVQKLSDGMGVPILMDGGNEAFYSPHQDRIHMPAAATFESEYAFNATALHELSHATGHPKRLNRSQTGFFGTSQYAYEELVAEICSCFTGFGLKKEADSRHIENHKAYVQSWIQTIREKPETLIRAIRDAQSAANYMDWKAGLITYKEYETTESKAFEVYNKEKERRDSR